METAIISGKGGTGKSSVVAAFATLLRQTVLADCDVDAANQYLLFDPSKEEEQTFTGSKEAVINARLCDNCGLCLRYCRFDALSVSDGQVMVSDIFCDGCGLCARICPREAITMKENNDSRLYAGGFRYGQMVYGRLAPGEENSGKLVNLVREKAHKMAGKNELKQIIIDGPPGIGCPVISTVTGVDQVVIVTEPGMSGLRDLQRVCELTQSFRIPLYVIINKADLHSANSEEIELFCNNRGICIAGRLSYDPLITDAMVHCKSITEYKPESAIAAEFKQAFRLVFHGHD